MGAFDDLAAQFDPVDKKRKGDQFELVCMWFLENDLIYKPLLRRVWLRNEWPGRANDIDAGIDLVAEDYDGKLWAIQAKAYDEKYSISKHDIDKFVAESSRKTYGHRLLIGTTDKRHHIATKLMDDLDIPFIGLTQLRQTDDYLNWPATLASLRPAKPLKAKKPWDYQQAAIKDVVNGFKTADRGQLIMACGTGKTLTAWFIREKLAAERTLVLVPSLSLLKQTMTEWRTANPKIPFAALPVCSDETAGSLGEDAAVSHTSDVGVPVTTNPEVIADFLRRRSGPRVVFSTYQSSPQIAAAFALGRLPAFDLVIADEAHRVAGPVSSDFATVLDPTAIKARQRLFMTATPRYFTGRVLREAKQADYEVASMDDHTKFGEVFHRLSFAEAIDRDLLTDYQVAIIGVDDATYRDWAERGTLVTLDGKKNTDARSLAGQIGLAKAMKKFDLHRMITFHSRVKAAREFAASMPAVLDWMPPRQRPKGSLWSRYTSGEMSAGERSVLIQHLKRLDDGERGLLANARCLSEGVDVPALDSVAFIDPRRSEVDIVQAVGRAIRRSDTKTVGTIVIPVFIDTDQDAQVALDSSVFKPVWDVIKALRAHDTELGEQLDALRREMGRRGSKPKLPGKIHVDVPASVSKDFSDAFEAHLVDATTAPWEFWYGLLEKYIAEHGHARVYVSFVLDGLRLGGWARGQRSAYVNGTLSESRRLKLESLPGWTWDPLSAQWEQGFEETVLYAGEHGDAMVHPRHTTDSGFRLGGWVAIQRTTYLEGSMSDERKVRLESIPGWSWRPRLSKWEVGFNHAVEYAREFGDTLVPFKFDSSDGYPLGRWIAMTRRTRIAGKLSEERQARLEALPGWSWDAIADQWEAGFKMLEKYAADNGDAMVPKKFMVGEFRLGGWVEEQRTKNSKGKLSTDRKVRLEALPGWSWGRRDTLWDIGYRHALEFAKQTGGAPIPVDFVCKDGYRLGQWMVGQRGAYRQNRLSPERQAKVEALPGWSWNAFAEKWEEGFGYLQGYVAEFGNAKVPQSYRCPDGFRLGQWVAVQRRNNVTGSINAERQRRLEALPGWVWSTR